MPAFIYGSNVPSLQIANNIFKANQAIAKSFERLSSGLRLNSAADGSADLAHAVNLNSQIRSYAVASQNANTGLSMAQTADGALSEINNALTRMRELAVEASSGSVTSTDRAILEVEFVALKSEITRIAESTIYNSKTLLASTTKSAIGFHVGINAATADAFAVTFGGLTLTNLTVNASTLSGALSANSLSAITAVDAAIVYVGSSRADVGAGVSRLTFTINNITNIKANLTNALSRLQDTDVAAETAELARNQVIAQAGAAVLAQSNQAPALILQLLGG